jgi:hypothetical protein
MVMVYQWKALLGGNYSATSGLLVEKEDSDRLPKISCTAYGKQDASDAAVFLLSNRSSKHALPQCLAASLFRGVALA